MNNKQRRKIQTFAFTLLIVTGLSSNAFATTYNPNNIISDAEFIQSGTMSVGAIQSFLESNGSILATAPASTLGSGNPGLSAAQIISKSATGEISSGAGISVRINEKVLLATLQKEQSLITLSTYDVYGDPQRRLEKAMGYACPDSGGCDPKYAGFYNQVSIGAWQLAWNRIRGYMPTVYDDFQVGRSYTYTNTNPGGADPCNNGAAIPATSAVTLENGATASLYRYTPHWMYGNCNFARIYDGFFDNVHQTGIHPPSPDYIAVTQFSSPGDQDVVVYQAPVGETHASMVGQDKWLTPASNKIVAMAGGDIDNDGQKEVMTIVDQGGGNYDFFVHEPAVHGDEHQPAIAVDKWNVPAIPAGGRIVDLTGADVNGDGDDEVAVLKQDAHGYQKIEIYDVFPGVEMFPIVAVDDFGIAGGNNIKSLAASDVNGNGIDDIVTLQENRGGDQDILIYTPPNGFDAQHQGQLIAGDKWNIPQHNNFTKISSADANGDGIDELVTLAKNGGDYDVILYEMPKTVGFYGAITGYDYWEIPHANGNIVDIAGVN